MFEIAEADFSIVACIEDGHRICVNKSDLIKRKLNIVELLVVENMAFLGTQISRLLDAMPPHGGRSHRRSV